MRAFPILFAVLFVCGAYFSIISATGLTVPESLTVVHIALCDVNCTVGSCFTCCTINQYPQGGICINLACYCN